MKRKTIGVYSGVFDPIHNGHVAFAQQAIEQGKVDEVYFIVESQPRRKQNVTPYEHRFTMAEIATRDKLKLNVLSVDQSTFSTSQTLPFLQATFPEATLCLLMGSDLFDFVESWPDYNVLRRSVTFGVARRHDETVDHHKLNATDWMIDSPHPHISSSLVRNSAISHETALPRAVASYLSQTKLYPKA